VDLSRRHVSASLTATPSIFTAGRTVVLPPEGPELRGDSAGACSRLVSGFLATSKIAATASVRIWCLSDPCEFGVDRANRKAAPGHGFNSPRETVFDVDTVTARTHKNVDRLEAKKTYSVVCSGESVRYKRRRRIAFVRPPCDRHVQP
jgi:hypothetical protein